MRPAEGVAFIEQEVSVAHIECGEYRRPLFSQRPRCLQIEDRVRRFVRRPVALQKSRPVTNGDRGPPSRGDLRVHSGRQRVALVVVQEEEFIRGRLESRESAGDAAFAFDPLVGVREVRLRPPARREAIAACLRNPACGRRRW